MNTMSSAWFKILKSLERLLSKNPRNLILNFSPNLLVLIFLVNFLITFYLSFRTMLFIVEFATSTLNIAGFEIFNFCSMRLYVPKCCNNSVSPYGLLEAQSLYGQNEVLM